MFLKKKNKRKEETMKIKELIVGSVLLLSDIGLVLLLVVMYLWLFN